KMCSTHKSETADEVPSQKQWLSKGKKSLLNAMLALLVIGIPEVALAQYGGGGNASFFCYFAKYFKEIIVASAVVAISMWALEHIFGMSKLHDIVMRVGIACGVVIAATLIISNTGLTVNCVL